MAHDTSTVVSKVPYPQTQTQTQTDQLTCPPPHTHSGSRGSRRPRSRLSRPFSCTYLTSLTFICTVLDRVRVHCVRDDNKVITNHNEAEFEWVPPRPRPLTSSKQVCPDLRVAAFGPFQSRSIHLGAAAQLEGWMGWDGRPR